MSSEDTTSGKRATLKYGYEITNQAEIVNKVHWPHGFRSILQHNTNTEPDGLSVEAFLWLYNNIASDKR